MPHRWETWREFTPFLFSIFLNDLKKIFIELHGTLLELVKEKCESELHIFMKLLVILNADDTVILSDTKERMQNTLDIFQSYCLLWKLKVNVNKTKIIIFSKGKVKQHYEFK